jgi:hypothetical protein
VVAPSAPTVFGEAHNGDGFELEEREGMAPVIYAHRGDPGQRMRVESADTVACCESDPRRKKPDALVPPVRHTSPRALTRPRLTT